MTDDVLARVLAVVAGYLVLAVALGIAIGRRLRRARREGTTDARP